MAPPTASAAAAPTRSGRTGCWPRAASRQVAAKADTAGPAATAESSGTDAQPWRHRAGPSNSLHIASPEPSPLNLHRPHRTHPQAQMQPPAPLVHTPPPAIPAMPAPRTPAAAVHAAAHRVSQVVPVPGSYANRAGCEHFLQPSPAYIRCPDHYRYLARTQHPFQRRATASGDLPGPDKSTFVQRSGDLALAVTAARSVGFDEAIAMGFRRSAHSHALLAAGQLDPSGRTLRISLTPHGLQ